MKAQVTMTANSGYNELVNRVYSGITHTSAKSYHTKTAEALEDLATSTANDQNTFTKLA